LKPARLQHRGSLLRGGQLHHPAAGLVIVTRRYNIEHGDNLELMESIAGLYNRLLIWDAALFHRPLAMTTSPPTAPRPPGWSSCSFDI
jgi:hypothetical protein